MRIDSALGVRFHRVTGTLALDELVRHLQDLYANETYDPGMNVLWDIREADVSSFTREDVITLRDFVKDKWGAGDDGRAALVVAEELSFGLARMYGTLLESQTSSKVTIFRDMDEAIDWLVS
jgi:hypothetical protein